MHSNYLLPYMPITYCACLLSLTYTPACISTYLLAHFISMPACLLVLHHRRHHHHLLLSSSAEVEVYVAYHHLHLTDNPDLTSFDAYHSSVLASRRCQFDEWSLCIATCSSFLPCWWSGWDGGLDGCGASSNEFSPSFLSSLERERENVCCVVCMREFHRCWCYVSFLYPCMFVLRN